MKKIMALLLFVLIPTILLSSCKIRDRGDSTTGGEYIYSKNSDLALVYDLAEVTGDNALSITEALQNVISGELKVAGTDSPKDEHEIILGKSERSASIEAYKFLERIETKKESDVRCLIYSDGTSLALAYDGDYWGIAAAESTAIGYVVDYLLRGEELKIEKGIVYHECIDSIAWQEKIDAAELEEQWQRIEANFAQRTDKEIAAEITLALKEYYSVYTDDVVSWIANLYDPVTGGFYYSNSARDTEGFLPDLESTYQLLGLPPSLGMTEGKSVGEFYPQEMADAIVNWVKSLQDPQSGYFYHPQWGKSFTDQIPNRRGRDLQWAEKLLAYFGASPTYDTPNGVKGDGIPADGMEIAPTSAMLTGSLSCSSVTAVSKVVAVEYDDSNVTPHLRTEKAFKEYLAGLDINGDSYTIGNLLESQSTQIAARDKVLASRGEKYSLCDILHKWLNDHQNKNTGLWTLDGSKDYAAVNGLLKIGSTYNKIGKEIPNAILALDAAIDCITSSEKPNHICDVLNPLYAVTILKQNLSSYSTGNVSIIKQQLENANNRLLNDAINIIEVTREKVAMFKKMDGSFSYYPTQTAAASQGATVALVGMNEGDANTANIALAAIPGHLFQALGIGDKPEFCTKADGVRYLAILSELGPIIKDAADDERGTAKGEYVREYGGEFYPDGFLIQQVTDLYRASTYIACNDEEMKNPEQEKIRILEDEDRSTGVLEYSKSTSPSTHGFVVRRTGTQAGGNCFVFETEIKLDVLDDNAMSAILAQKQPILLNFTPGIFESATSAKAITASYLDSFGAVYIGIEDGKYYSYFSHATKPYQYISYGKDPYNGKEIQANKWFTVTVELYDNGMAKYYINNKYFEEVRLFDDTTDFFTALDVVKVNFGYYATSSSVWVDNTFVGTVQKEYVDGDAIRSYDYIGPGNYGVSYGGLDYNVDSFQVLQQKGYITRSTWNTIGGVEDKSYSDTSFHREFARISSITREEAVEKVFEFGARTTNAKGIYMRETNSGNGDAFVFETELFLDVDDGTAAKICKLGAAPIFYFHIGKSSASSSVPANDPNYTGSELARIYANKDSSGKLRYFFNAPVGKGYMACTSGAEITEGWHTVTMEMFSNGYVKYYVDGNLLGEAKVLSSQDVSKFNELNSVKLSIDDVLDNSYFFLDNTYITWMDITYAPTAPDSGSDDEGESGDGGEVESPFVGNNVDAGGWG